MQPITKAIILASAVHDHQYRKGNGLSYITHPLSVVSRLKKILEFNSQEYNTIKSDLLICAALHDVYEDAKTFDIKEYCDYVKCEPKETIQELIIDLFGNQVHEIIFELTNDLDKIKQIGKTEYLKQKLLTLSPEAFLIKCIDRLDNLEDCKDMGNESKAILYSNTYEIWKYVSANRKCNLDHTVVIANIMTICKNYITDNIKT